MPPATQPKRQTRVLDIRTGDQVLVLTGKDAGKKGTVSKVVVNTQGWKKSTAKFGAGWQTQVAAGRCRRRRRRHQRREAEHQAPLERRTDRPSAARPAGRHPGHRDAPQHQQRHDHLPFVLAAHTGPPHGGRPMVAASGPVRHCAEPLTRVEKKRK